MSGPEISKQIELDPVWLREYKPSKSFKDPRKLTPEESTVFQKSLSSKEFEIPPKLLPKSVIFTGDTFTVVSKFDGDYFTASFDFIAMQRSFALINFTHRDQTTTLNLETVPQERRPLMSVANITYYLADVNGDSIKDVVVRIGKSAVLVYEGKL